MLTLVTVTVIGWAYAQELLVYFVVVEIVIGLLVIVIVAVSL
jgi:hypothetical protein